MANMTISAGAKTEIIKILREQGYPRYANLVSYFDIFLTSDPNVVGYMIPGKAVIVLNEGLNIYQVSTIVRHEILHEYFTHGPRKDAFDKNHPEIKGNQEIANIAADYEISNRGYTQDDKENVRRIKLNGTTLKGLVTEDRYPEWKGMSFEEMYHELLKERQKDKDKMKDLMDQISQLSQKNIRDLEDLLDNMEQQSSKQSQDSSTEDQQQSSSPDQKDENSSDNTQSSNEVGASSDDNSEEQEKIDELQDAVDAVKQELADLETSKDGKFDTPEEQRSKVDVAARVEKIMQEIRSTEAYDEIMWDTSAAVRKDRIASVKRNAVSNYAKNGNGGLKDFQLDLKRFISSQVSQTRERSWERPDARYKRRGFLVQGRVQHNDVNVPVINVYWDTSKSFSNPAKTAAARAAIDSIQSYVKKGLIEVDVYYHSDDVYDHPVFGGNDGDKVVEHIKATHPDNIIIITDGDLYDTSESVTVPGAAWFLFYDSTSEGLIKHVKGRKQSRWYMVKY